MSRIWDDVNDDPDVHVGPRLRNLRPKLASARSLLAPRQSSTTCDIVVPTCGNPAERAVTADISHRAEVDRSITSRATTKIRRRMIFSPPARKPLRTRSGTAAIRASCCKARYFEL